MMPQANLQRTGPAPVAVPSPALRNVDPSGLRRAADNTNALPRIDHRYVLVMPVISYVDESGGLWLDTSWHRDLYAHMGYLTDLVLCTPARPYAGQQGLVRFEPPAGTSFSFVALPSQTSYLSALRELPETARSLYQAIASADVVHSGIIGWPYPLGWIANPLATALGKKLIVVVESPWRMRGADRRKPWHRVLDLDWMREQMARWSVRNADLALFTQPLYRAALAGNDHQAAHITPAVWIEEDEIVSNETAERLWDAKLAHPPRFLFAGRLLASKGLDVLLSALRKLDQSGRGIHVDIIGSGALRETCVRAAAELKDVKLSVLDPVPYGTRFFELVQGYDVVLVPSLSDEQPRIVFDANARAVPVFASATEGVRPHVAHEQSGRLLPPGDVDALARALSRALVERPRLRELGMNALERTRGLTHRNMHEHRAGLIDRLCGSLDERKGPVVTGRYTSA